MTDRCPLIEISGPPHARGVQYGRQAAARIRQGADTYARQIAKSGHERFQNIVTPHLTRLAGGSADIRGVKLRRSP